MRKRSQVRPRLESHVQPHEEIIAHIKSFLKRRRAQGYIVGGFLRDLLLGRVSKDLDIVVKGVSPTDVARYLHLNLSFSRPALFPRFKTVLTVRDDLEIEICRLQGDLRDDAQMRDFTVNCLYADLTASGSSLSPSGILDPTDRGISDLKAGILVAPSEPCFTLWLDPIRILRAVRFHATMGFRLDKDLLDAMPRLVFLLGRIAAERIRMELEKILLSRRLIRSFRIMHSLGVTEVILPELDRTCGFWQSTPYHAYDLFTHSVKTAAKTPPELTLRIAGLLHDVGKVETRVDKSDRAVYYGHQEASASIAVSILERLRFAKRLTNDVRFLIRHHMINYSRRWTDRAIRRFVRKMGDHLEQVLILVEADRKAQRPRCGLDGGVRDLRRRIRKLEQQESLQLGLSVTGHVIMAILRIKEGPIVGEAKGFLLEQAAKRGRPMTRQESLGLLKKWASARESS